MNRNFWERRRVFVTGCSGLLGSWLARELVDLGAEVTGLVRDLVPQSQLVRSGTVDEITVVRGDVEDHPLLTRVLSEYESQVVFHLAAQAIVGTANRTPLPTFRANIAGTWNVLEACRTTSTIESVIVASSDKAYGSQSVLPYTEDMPLQGRHPYDVSKSCTDLLAQTYATTYGLPVALTRCGNFFGGGDLNFNRIIPGTIKSVLEGSRPIIRSDGSYIRDYIYVRDVVSGYLTLAEKMGAAPGTLSGEAFNFSNDTQLDVLRLTLKILALMGRSDLEPVILNEARGEIKNQYLSAAKARRELGWSPTFGIEDGLKETIDWYREYHAGRSGRR